MYLKRIITLIAVTLFVQPSFSQHIRKLSKQDLSSMYSEFSFTSFQSSVYHKNDSVSTVYLGVKPDDFSFLPDTLNGPLTARIGVFYELFNDWDAKLPYDTGSIMVTDTSSIGKSLEMIINLDVEITYPSEQILIVTLIDKNKDDKRVSKIIPIDKIVSPINIRFLAFIHFKEKFIEDNFYDIFFCIISHLSFLLSLLCFNLCDGDDNILCILAMLVMYFYDTKYIKTMISIIIS